MARFLHMSDLHIGARLGRHSQNDDIKKCLGFAAECAKDAKIDAILVCGDVFDTFNPSGESEDIYYNFLDAVSCAGIETFIISGNHDNCERLSAPAPLLRRHRVRVASYAPGALPEPFEAELGGERFSIVPVPHVPDGAFPSGISEDPEMTADIFSRSYCAMVSEACSKAGGGTLIVMGHLFARGASPGGGERKIQRGNSSLVDMNSMPDNVAYYAFGHLHRPQKVADKAFYCGSLVPVSMDEAAYRKKLYIADVSGGRPASVETVDLPRYSGYETLRGSFEEICAAAEPLRDSFVALTYLETIGLAERDRIASIMRRNGLRLVSQSFELCCAPGQPGMDAAQGAGASLEELFEAFMRHRNCHDPKLLAKFEEILAAARGDVAAQ